MDSDQFVPIWTIASMEGVKLLTTDMDLILEVLRGNIKINTEFCPVCITCMLIMFSVLISLSHGAGGWERRESTAQPQTMHYHPQRSTGGYTCWGKTSLFLFFLRCDIVFTFLNFCRREASTGLLSHKRRFLVCLTSVHFVFTLYSHTFRWMLLCNIFVLNSLNSCILA